MLGFQPFISGCCFVEGLSIAWALENPASCDGSWALSPAFRAATRQTSSPIVSSQSCVWIGPEPERQLGSLFLLPGLRREESRGEQKKKGMRSVDKCKAALARCCEGKKRHMPRAWRGVSSQIEEITQAS